MCVCVCEIHLEFIYVDAFNPWMNNIFLIIKKFTHSRYYSQSNLSPLATIPTYHNSLCFVRKIQSRIKKNGGGR